MELSNQTPFVPFTFRSLDLADEEFQVVVLKGTFDIVPGSAPVRSGSQDPICLEAEPFEGCSPFSVRYPDDLAPFKPRTDILVAATSYAPGGRPASEWLAGISVGRVTKQLLVTGPRVWVHGPMLGWILGAPAPTLSVPIRYDNAYGGIANRAKSEDAYPQNPVGRGFVDLPSADKSLPIRTPSILRPGVMLSKPGDPYPVEGLSAIHQSWSPRLERAGTYDDEWLTTRHPNLPEDFDFGFYNCAYPDLIYPGHLKGGEEVRLERLCRDHEHLHFRLPAFLVGVSVADQKGNRHGEMARLDTVHIDAERLKLRLVWRAAMPLSIHGLTRIDVQATELSAAMLESFPTVQKVG